MLLSAAIHTNIVSRIIGLRVIIGEHKSSDTSWIIKVDIKMVT